MPYILSYTKKDDVFSGLVERPKNMSGHIYFSDVYEAMHLAISRDGKCFVPLRNNTGILFPKASFSEGKPEGTTKTLRDPWLFERADGTYGVCAIRRNEDGVDPLSIGSVMLFSSRDLIRYEETGFFRVAEEEILSPRCRYDLEKKKYYIEYSTAQGIFHGYTADFVRLEDAEQIPAYTLKNASIGEVVCTGKNLETVTEIHLLTGYGPEREHTADEEGVTSISTSPRRCEPEREHIAGVETGVMPENFICHNVLEISETVADRLEGYLGVIRHVSVDPVIWKIFSEKWIGENAASEGITDLAEHGKESLCQKNLPRAVCRYSDGSVHEKQVDWDTEALAAIDFTKPGTYEIPGRIRQKHWPFPMMKEEISDPCITRYQGKYYLSATGMRDVSFRVSDTIEGCFRAKRRVVWSLPAGDRKHANIWAQELHVIRDVPYVFTTVANPEWYTVQSHVLRCTGSPEEPKAWEEPRLCVKPDGTPLEEHGISLDMTYFCVEGVHYVMWSNRVVHVDEPGYGKKRVVCEPADIFIAMIDPDAPWQLTSDPVRVLRPQYGWDRLNTEVDEGPYLLRHGDDLFVTISGSSTGVADLYCLGLLHARAGSDLLCPENWDWLPYPVLTKESVPGEFGPGHNNFVKDEETGDDLMVYHAVPHDGKGKSLGRHAGVRRVHWAANGYPYLEMTEERDLDPALRDITMKVVVE